MIKQFDNMMESIVSLRENNKILLAVSGGMDSMAMLYMFQQSKYKFAVANVNFSLRNNESDTDSLFVKEYCLDNNIDLYATTFDTKAYAQKNKISTQMAARDLRYNWFAKLKQENDFSKIAIAHHLDDQAETFFINIIRGTGIAGMHGISIHKDDIIRPMMFAIRNDIENYITNNQIPYREDSSNASDKYQRNYIRHHILPEFKKLRTDFSESLHKSISQLHEIEDYALHHISKDVKSIINYESENELIINSNTLSECHSPNLILYYCLKDYGFQQSHINNIIELINSNKVGKSIQSSQYEILIERHTIVLRPKQQKEIKELSIDSLDDKNWQTADIKITKDFSGNYKVNNKNLAFVDFDKIKFPLTIRAWRNGDSFFPLGMNKKKMLSDFFTDNKLTRIEKEDIRILCSADSIIWILGHRIDNRYSINKDTTQIIKLEHNGNY